jgi:hypothetical protein
MAPSFSLLSLGEPRLRLQSTSHSIHQIIDKSFLYGVSQLRALVSSFIVCHVRLWPLLTNRGFLAVSSRGACHSGQPNGRPCTQ